MTAQRPVAALGLPRPGPGEFVSARLARCPEGGQLPGYARSVRIAGAEWRLAAKDDPPDPRLPCLGKSLTHLKDR